MDVFQYENDWLYTFLKQFEHIIWLFMYILNTKIMIEQHAEEDLLTHDGMEDIGG